MPRPRNNRGRYAKPASNRVAKQTPKEGIDPNKPYAISYLSKLAGAQLEAMEAEGLIRREKGQAIRFPSQEDEEKVTAAVGDITLSEERGSGVGREKDGVVGDDVDMKDAALPPMPETAGTEDAASPSDNEAEEVVAGELLTSQSSEAEDVDADSVISAGDVHMEDTKAVEHTKMAVTTLKDAWIWSDKWKKRQQEDFRAKVDALLQMSNGGAKVQEESSEKPMQEDSGHDEEGQCNGD